MQSYAATVILVFSFLFTRPADAQNLVKNPGFEHIKQSFFKLKPCNYVKEPSWFNRFVEDWNTFGGFTPDIVVRPDSLSNCFYPTPHRGKNMLGMILYHPSEDTGYSFDYHELVQGTLTEPLKPGKTYRISIWVYYDATLGKGHLQSIYSHKTSIYPLACNNLGFIFLDIKADEDENITQSIEFFEMKPQVVFKDVMLTPKGQWKQYSMTFTPHKAYRYFLMGNFSTDENTKTIPDDYRERFNKKTAKGKTFWQLPKRIAYYCFDDIRITLEEGKSPNMEASLAQSSSYTFQSLNFKSGKAVLSSSADIELDKLVTWLTQNPAKKIEISGYTDNVGREADNQILSGKRAKAVYDYLIQHGVAADRLRYKGYGEQNPIASNSTPDGRLKNRRVECRIVE